MINKENERLRILKSFDVYDVPAIYCELIIKSIESTEWDWFADMDGCSFAPNYWVTKYNPACLVHDYYWRTGRGGYWSDRIFLELMRIYGMPRLQRSFRFAMVRIGWLGFYKWKHKQNGNIRKLDELTLKIINKWKN